MRTLSLISLLIVSLLLAGCVMQPPPEPATPTVPAGPPVIEIAPTPTPDPVSTPTPQVRGLPDGRTYKQYALAPLMTIDPNATYRALIRTNKGDITLELFASEAPETVNNFVFLAREGYYDGIIFHRVIPNFMIQGGDPTATGGGGPGYEFGDEFVSSLVFDRAGFLAMANRGAATNGSQFFITVVPTPQLNNKHTIFGEVVEGQDVADIISTVPTDRDRPIESVIIEKIEIIER